MSNLGLACAEPGLEGASRAHAQAATGARADSGAGRRAQVFILPQPNQRSTAIQALTLGLCRSG